MVTQLEACYHQASQHSSEPNSCCSRDSIRHHLFFSSDLVDDIVDESNRYAQEVTGEEKYSKWSVLTVDDIRALLGFLF